MANTGGELVVGSVAIGRRVKVRRIEPRDVLCGRTRQLGGDVQALFVVHTCRITGSEPDMPFPDVGLFGFLLELTAMCRIWCLKMNGWRSLVVMLLSFPLLLLQGDLFISVL